ncbi:DUF885 domain-containing protein [Variovorax sp. YR752]|uniref:DUF885 domain-containing protein n=1 Tax=Variovorax sp. YR752 TaxID=1884383 RepID=UPI003137F9BD
MRRRSAAFAVVAALLLALAVFVINLVWFRPFSLDLFHERVFIEFALDSPETLSAIGIAESFGWRRHNAHLDDVSIAKGDRDFAKLRRNLADLRAYDGGALSPSQRLSNRVLDWFLQNQLDGERFRFHDYPVDQLWGVQNETPNFLINVHAIADRRGAEDYLARLSEIGRKYDQVIEGLQRRQQLGVVPPRFVIEHVLASMREFAGKLPAANPLYLHFAGKVATLPGLDDAERRALLDRCTQLIESGVVPAYRRLIAALERQWPLATTDDGAWKLPDGDAFYAWRLRRETTTELTPQQVHDIGVAEVARIEAEMAAILVAQSALREGETPGQALARLALDPRFLYTDDESGRQAALADYTAMIRDQLERSRALFGRLPEAAIEVRRVPEFKEKTAPGAYYNPPALDGSRPGIFFANLRSMAELPRFGMRTLAIHEGVPGHHFQIALAQEMSGVPTFRKVLPFTAYLEGWALYAESLGKEMALYEGDPYGDLGRLQAEMFRAVRLVVDTGIHQQRWPRERAVRYMVDKTGMPQASVVSEIERYVVEPGQACAYKIGMMRIQAARERAKQALGARFDAQALRDFHDLLLGSGALPLQVLDEQVDAWIAARR